ncbi:hypothetical protein V6N13_038588 [Hibiscus sabdariffa]|uniref:Uncharacterized protein n=2 Tax=Hibiscus sabdariffa TaxID=183260 RepID=A0ABR2B5E0_9ROSI
MLLRKSDRKVLYAEVSENFVELLFCFLTIPLESVLELVLGLKGNPTLGSISNLFRDLNTLFPVSKEKNSQKRLLPPFYSCPNEFPNIRSLDPPSFIVCSFVNCKKESNVLRKPLDPKYRKWSSENSLLYVEKNLLFVVSDDLVVKQLSSVSSISLLKETGIALGGVEQKTITIGEVEAIALLGASLWTSSPLSALLNSLAKKPKQEAV